MRIIYLLSVWLHILAAATWLGGMLFLTLVLVPVVRRPAYRSAAGELFHLTGARFRWVGWICFGLLILSGTFNLIYRGVTWDDVFSSAFWLGAWGRILGTKLLLVATILLASAYHDFVIGPQATLAWRKDPRGARSQSLRRQASLIGRINLIAGLVVVILAVMLVRGGF
jgi:uncharacterized membrane protein